MSVNNEFVRYVLDQLRGLGVVISRKMFGGAGLYLDCTIFALISYATLYFKVDETNRSDFEEAGMEPFQPFDETSYVMSYYEVPIDILEESDELVAWAKKALVAARRAPSKKKKEVKKKGS
jgi:DNA transformation protein and related proteins